LCRPRVKKITSFLPIQQLKQKVHIFFRVARSLSFFGGGGGGLMFLANFDLKIYDFILLKGFLCGKNDQNLMNFENKIKIQITRFI
jgi:hypothetical protein